MKKTYTKYFEVSLSSLEEREVFNGCIDKDSQYYILPYKLENLNIPEFKDSYEKFKEYFRQVVLLLNQAERNSLELDCFFRRVVEKFHFHEIGHIGLGYSESGQAGSGIGRKLAESIAETAFKLVKAGIDNPEFFQIMGLLEEGIGADRISDMTLSILKDDFYSYTQRVAKELRLKTKKYQNYLLPFGEEGNPIIFCPVSILAKLPVSIKANDIEDICSHNKTLRSEVNQILGGAFDEGNQRLKKCQIRDIFLKKPELANKLFEKCKEKYSAYDFKNDPDGDIIWEKIANQIIDNYSLILSKTLSSEGVVNKICDQYKNLIENNGIWREFHNDDGTCKKESFGQNLFFAVASSYCKANDLDISPETDSGNGSVDFKMSRGARQKILVEMKLSSNNKLVSAYNSQTKAYQEAENTSLVKYVVVQVDEKHDSQIKKLFEEKNKYTRIGKKVPEIVVIDATKKKSASKR